MTTSEPERLRRAQDFDLEALGEIYDQYSPALYRYAMRLTNNRDQAEECVAETFSRFLLALRNRRGPETHLGAYLYRIAHNWITDQWRRQPPPPLPLDPEWEAAPGSDPDLAAAQRQQQARLRAALTRLTPEQRQVVALKFLEDWDNADIASALNKPVGAIKALQHRALAALRRLWFKEEGEQYELT